MGEIWKDIEGYEEYYQVSNIGRIKSVQRIIEHKRKGWHTVKERILSGRKNAKGYLEVALCKNHNRQQITIHRLVATAFIENSLHKTQIDHINGIKTDNRVENLRWCSQSENINNQVTLSNKSKKRVLQISINSDIEITQFISLNEAERVTGVDAANIRKCCIGIYRQSGGYKWQYVQ